MTDIIITPEEIKSFQEKNNIQPIKAFPKIDEYKVLTFSDLKQDTPQPIEYVCTPFLPAQGICFIYAPTGLGKTLFTLNLAYAIAGGGNFLKYSCPKPRKVLYVDGEMSYSSLHSRLMQISKVQGDLDFEENLRLMTPDKLYPLKTPMIDDQIGQSIYSQLIEKYNIEVIIFDNLSMLSSFDENKSHEWKPIQDWLLNLRAQGKSIINIHHSGKFLEGYRGTSRMLDCANTAISLQPVKEDSTGDEYIPGKKFKIVYQKNRDFGGVDALTFEVMINNGLWTYRPIEQSDLDQVVALAKQDIPHREIGKELNLSFSKVYRLIGKAKKLHLL